MRLKTRLSASLIYAFAVLSLCGAVPLAACGTDGNAPYAGWDTVEDSAGVYRLRYLSPPWERVPRESGDATLELIVPPVFGSLDAGAPSKYGLRAQLVPGLALPVLRAEVARIAGGRVVAEPAPFATLSVDNGFQAVVADDAHLRYFDLVALAAPGDRTLFVRVELNEDPRRDAELGALLRAIDVRPFVD